MVVLSMSWTKIKSQTSNVLQKQKITKTTYFGQKMMIYSHVQIYFTSQNMDSKS